MSSKLLTEKEVAENYRISVYTLRNQRVSGKGFKFVKLGKKVLYNQKDIENLIENNTFESTTQYQNHVL